MSAADGFINVLKPPGMTSAAVVGYVRRLLGGAKAGHAGTLDPEAAGVLPVMVGKATRLFDYLQDKEKAYVAEVAFGAATDTEDAQGEVIKTGEAYPDEAAIRGALASFTGVRMQRPSAYSAIKRDGHKLYELARRGEQVTVEPREVTIYQAELRRIMPGHGALVFLRCSKGFYVRAFCRELGEALGCPAHMRFLLRAAAGAFTLDTAVTPERLQEAAEEGRLQSLMLPMKFGLRHLPDAEVPKSRVKQFMNGVPLPYELYKPLPPARITDAVAYDASPANSAQAPLPLPDRDGAPVCLWLEGRLCAIAAREDGCMKVKTWLGE